MAQQILTPPPSAHRRSRSVLLVVLVTVVLLGSAGAAVALLIARGTGERAIGSATLSLADGRAVGRVDFFDARPGVS